MLVMRSLLIFMLLAAPALAAAETLPLDQRPAWLSREGIVMAGSWEPLNFRVCRDGASGCQPTTKQRAAYEQEQSTEMLERLKALGVNFVMMHYHKGAGLDAEAESMRDAVKFSRLCHDAGMRVGVYACSGTLLWDLFFTGVRAAEACKIDSRSREGVDRKSSIIQIIYDHHLNDLKRYKALVLAGCVAISDKQAEQIRRYVCTGGRLCVIGPAGTHDEWIRPQQQSVLNGLPGDRVIRIDAKSDPLEAIRRVCDGQLALSVSGPLGLCAELTEQKDRRMVHLVNYRHDGPTENVKASLRLPKGRRAVSLALSSPQRDHDLRVPFTQKCETIEFTVPSVGVYEIAVICLGPCSSKPVCLARTHTNCNTRSTRIDRRLGKVIRALESGNRTVRIVAFGDSITGVYYHTGGRRSWPDLLKIALKRLYPHAKIEMFNAGVSGHNSHEGLSRIDRDVLAKHPDLVVVMFGMNDVPSRSPEAFRKDMIKIADRCKAAGAEVVFSTQNSIGFDSRRPMSRLREFTQSIRDLAEQLNLPLADVFETFEMIRQQDPTEWQLLMSDAIHPNFTGHKKLAETIAQTIAGRTVSLDDVRPAHVPLRFTIDRLRRGLPVKIVAMPPYDDIVAELLKKYFPDAILDVVTWPVEGRTLEQIEAWTKGVRKLKPNLVVIAVPPTATAEDKISFIRRYNWLLACSMSHGNAQWDLLPILPEVTGLIPEGAFPWYGKFTRQIISGTDHQAVDRNNNDTCTTKELLDEWIGKCVRSSNHGK